MRQQPVLPFKFFFKLIHIVVWFSRQLIGEKEKGLALIIKILNSYIVEVSRYYLMATLNEKHLSEISMVLLQYTYRNPFQLKRKGI